MKKVLEFEVPKDEESFAIYNMAPQMYAVLQHFSKKVRDASRDPHASDWTPDELRRQWFYALEMAGIKLWKDG